MNQTETYFSSGIEEVRHRDCINYFLVLFNDLEEGELIDLTNYEQLYFFNFLHPTFKKYHLKKEEPNLYSVHLKMVLKDRWSR